MLGSISYEISEEHSCEIFGIVKTNRIPTRDMCSKKGVLTLDVPYEASGLFEGHLNERGIDFKITKRKGMCLWISKVLWKKGMMIGCAVSWLLIMLLSGTVFSFEILNDSPKVRRDILSVLYENGITAGSSIKNIDMTVIERDLKHKVKDISWAGISIKGCKMIIDTVNNIPKPKYTQTRLPSNLVACENGVIERVVLSDGQLMKPVGSGVVKGDIIVSGRVVSDRVYYKGGVEQHDIHKRYARSIGTVYGTFERTFSFTQPYSRSIKVRSDNVVKNRYITLFDTVIPIGFDKSGEFACISSESSSPTLFGLELPLSFTTELLEGYTVRDIPLSENQARWEATARIDAYEKNFLSDYLIKDRKITAESTENGINMTAVYTLYGEISEEVEFFVDK